MKMKDQIEWERDGKERKVTDERKKNGKKQARIRLADYKSVFRSWLNSFVDAWPMLEEIFRVESRLDKKQESGYLFVWTQVTSIDKEKHCDAKSESVL